MNPQDLAQITPTHPNKLANQSQLLQFTPPNLDLSNLLQNLPPQSNQPPPQANQSPRQATPNDPPRQATPNHPPRQATPNQSPPVKLSASSVHALPSFKKPLSPQNSNAPPAKLVTSKEKKKMTLDLSEDSGDLETSAPPKKLSMISVAIFSSVI
jgi:hypothetical protein